ncbi:MAG: hypothetical protein JXA46_05875 [Dehalococcoidales bacterium]|nr:hypothetical protein [Dehalococcoidales bacterium]
MAAEYVMSLDAGTSALRCLVFDLHGNMVSHAGREYTCCYLSGEASLGREMDPAGLWNATCEAISLALRSSGLQASDLAGISAASQREGMVFLDGSGRELYAGPNIDLRAVTEGLALDTSLAADIYRITGHLPSLLFAPARLIWFRNNRPDIFEKVSTVLSIGEWLLFRLSGTRAGEICEAVELGLADVAVRQVSQGLMELLGLPGLLCPSPVKCGSRTGRVTAAAAADTGLAEGTPVVQGAPDSHCGLIGMGVAEEGQTGIVSGWSTTLQRVTAAPVFDTACRTWTGCHPFPDRWILESNSGESGHALEWVRMNLSHPEGLPAGEEYGLIDRLALSVPAGAEGVLAFIGPETMDSRNLGLRWGGFIFPLPFSACDTGRAQLYRAALENIAYAVRTNLEQLEAVARRRTGQVRMGGGLVRSSCLKKLLPAVTGCPVSFAQVAETSGLGAAMLAAAGSGIYSGLEECMTEMCSPLETAEPDRLMAAEYEEYYQHWLAAGRRLKEMGEELN